MSNKIKKLKEFLSYGCTCENCFKLEHDFGIKIINCEEINTLSENLVFHIENNISLSNSIFRVYSDAFYSLINEARHLYESDKIILSPLDRALIETDIGKFEYINGEKIYLDCPFEIDDLNEAKYKNRTVNLNKPFRTPSGPKKFAVYVRDPKTDSIKIVRFGDPNLKIRNDDPKRAANFRARHKCSQARDKTSPRYWSCNVHRYRKLLGLKSKNPW